MNLLIKQVTSERALPACPQINTVNTVQFVNEESKKGFIALIEIEIEFRKIQAIEYIVQFVNVEAKKKFIVLIQKYETNPTSSRKDADDCPKIYSFVYLF